MFKYRAIAYGSNNDAVKCLIQYTYDTVLNAKCVKLFLFAVYMYNIHHSVITQVTYLAIFPMISFVNGLTLSQNYTFQNKISLLMSHQQSTSNSSSVAFDFYTQHP